MNQLCFRKCYTHACHFNSFHGVYCCRWVDQGVCGRQEAREPQLFPEVSNRFCPGPSRRRNPSVDQCPTTAAEPPRPEEPSRRPETFGELFLKSRLAPDRCSRVTCVMQRPSFPNNGGCVGRRVWREAGTDGEGEEWGSERSSRQLPTRPTPTPTPRPTQPPPIQELASFQFS